MLAYQGVALATCVAALFLAIQWLGKGLSGASVEQTRVFFIIPFAVGLIFLGSGLWIFGIRRSQAAGRAFALFSTSAVLVCVCLFDLYTTQRLWLLWALGLALVGGALVDLALVFPQEAGWVRRAPYLRLCGYGIGLVLFIRAALIQNNFQPPQASISNWRSLSSMDGLAMLFLVGMLIYRRAAGWSPVVRQQAGALLAGSLVAFGPLAIWFLAKSHAPQGIPADPQWLRWVFSGDFPVILLLPTVIFPLFTGTSILRHRMVRTDLMFRQGMLYALLSVLALGGYALLVSGLTLIFGQALHATNPLLIGGVVFILALGLNPLRNRLRQFVDAVFFRGMQAYEQRVESFRREMTNTVDLATIVSRLRQHIQDSLLPEILHIYIHDPINDLYAAVGRRRRTGHQ